MKLFKRLTAALLIACLCLSLYACKKDGDAPGKDGGASATTTGGGNTGPANQGQNQTYTIRLVTESGVPLGGVGIYVYEDATQNELVTFARTDDNGIITFQNQAMDGMVAILDKVPDGYDLQDNYPLTGANTEILLKTAMISGDGYIGKKFGLGDVMWDLTVTDLEGNTHQLSKLLETHEAVMLNFWYLDCAPCRMEFPYLQQAYAEHGNKVPVLALNAVDQDAGAIRQYVQTAGLTMPVAQVSSDVTTALGINSFPTTVVIDRFGTISLMHAKGIEGGDAFGDVMTYFVGEDYKPGVITDVNTIITPEDNDDEIIDNPDSVGGVKEFQLTVRPGETVYCDVYKANDMYLTIQDKTAELTYNGKTYTYQNGRVRTTLYCKDTYTPATIALKNVGTETTTYTLTLAAKAGSLDNPYKLELGEFGVSISSGKEEGIYYRYTAPADGYLILQCLSASEGVPYGYNLYNMNSYAMRNLESDSVLDGDGKVVVRMACHKGDKVQFNPSALPDSSGNYPGIQMKFLASFQEGLDSGDLDVEKFVYAVTVVDKDMNGIPGVDVVIDTEDGKQQTLTTNDKGVAAVKLPAGEYKATLRIGAGYTARVTEVVLTQDAPTQALRMDAVVINTKTYTVTVTDSDGNPLENVLVTVGETAVNTDANGLASFTLEEGSYTAVIAVPEGYTSEALSYTFPEGENALAVVLTKGSSGNEDEGKIDYCVTVTDYFGAPLRGVTVTFLQDGSVKGLQTVNDAGKAIIKLLPGEYTATLAFSSGAYTYDASVLVLTEAAPDVTVSAIAKRGNEVTELYVGDAYSVNVGATYLEGMQSNVVNYFMFKPTVSGHYKISTTDPAAVVSYWGANVFFISDQTGAVKVEGENAISLAVREEYLNDDTVYIIGVTGAQTATLLIERTGDIILTDEEKAEWIIYEAKEPAEEFDLVLAAGEKLTYLDLTSENITLVKGADGYYHLDTEKGPILYVNLGTDGRYMPFHAMLGFEQAGGTGFQCVFYEGEKFIKKEDYTICMQSFVKACVDSKGYGVYPLNDDLIYMIQNGGAAKGWYEIDDPSYLFEGVEVKNPELLWMFSLMYVTK